MNDLIVIGTSHKHAPVDVRSCVALAEDELPEAYRQLLDRYASEAAILTTCNRTEIYLVPNADGVEPEEIRGWLMEFRGIDLKPEHFFTLGSGAGARHLMEVAAGVDSQVIGDIQIIGQVKDAYLTAREHGALGKVLTRVFETALRAGKRVKTETELFTGAVSISYVAVELARKIFHPLESQRTLVVGAGETGELTAGSLRGRGVRDIVVTNRTESRGRDLIERLGFGEWLPMDRMRDELHRFDIVIVATGARDYVLSYDTMHRAAGKRSGDPMLVVDLSVPRNVDPRVSDIGNIFCKDLNDLNGVIEDNVVRRREEIPKAEQIISEELDELTAWSRTLSITPVIADLKRRAESIAHDMLEQNKGRFTEADFRNVEKLVGSVVRKIIGIPMSHLLNAGHDPEGAQRKAEYIRELFSLGGSGDADEESSVRGVNGSVNGGHRTEESAEHSNATSEGHRGRS